MSSAASQPFPIVAPAAVRSILGPPARQRVYETERGIPPRLEHVMAKGQKRSSREVRKPKAEKPPKQNASNPSLKPGGIKGLENMKNG